MEPTRPTPNLVTEDLRRFAPLQLTQLSERAQEVVAQLRLKGASTLLNVYPDFLVCQETGTCLTADEFEVLEVHAVATGPVRELIYLVHVPKYDALDIIIGRSEELRTIDEPQLYCKLLVIWC
ncbi:MAG: hypothetical protein SFY70_05580 [Bacteroidia bacterium]|nr:hypothetical protein [Bacteroidia bacterium]